MKTRVKEITYKNWEKSYIVEIHRFLWVWDFHTETKSEKTAIAYSNRVNERYGNIAVKETILN